MEWGHVYFISVRVSTGYRPFVDRILTDVEMLTLRVRIEEDCNMQ